MQCPQWKNLSDKEIGYLAGLFVGDGYANYNKKDRHYNVEFYLHSSRDQDIQIYLSSILKKAKLHLTIFKDPRYKVNRVKISSRIFLYFIREQVQKFKIKHRFNKEFLLGVVSGFIDAEGCVKKGSIHIAQKDGRTIQKIQEMCHKMRVNCNIRKTKNTPKGFIWRGIISTRFKYLPHNSRKVGRIYGCFP